MGSFDGWSQREDLSPEYSALFTKFSTTLFLRPGRYYLNFILLLFFCIQHQLLMFEIIRVFNLL